MPKVIVVLMVNKAYKAHKALRVKLETVVPQDLLVLQVPKVQLVNVDLLVFKVCRDFRVQLVSLVHKESPVPQVKLDHKEKQEPLVPLVIVVSVALQVNVVHQVQSVAQVDVA